MDVLSKLFGSEAKVKIMRLFLFNPDTPFGRGGIGARARVSLPVVRHETTLLRKMGMIKGKRFVVTNTVKRGKKLVLKKKKEGGWILNPAFPYLPAIRNLLINTVLVKNSDILRRLNTVGKMRLIILAGTFIQDEDSRVDLLVVGDNIRSASLESVIRVLESEIGKELRYAAFETADFHYRLGIYDKLIRDILDYPHQKLLDRIGLSPDA